MPHTGYPESWTCTLQFSSCITFLTAYTTRQLHVCTNLNPSGLTLRVITIICIHQLYIYISCRGGPHWDASWVSISVMCAKCVRDARGSDGSANSSRHSYGSIKNAVGLPQPLPSALSSTHAPSPLTCGYITAWINIARLDKIRILDRNSHIGESWAETTDGSGLLRRPIENCLVQLCSYGRTLQDRGQSTCLIAHWH